MTEICNLAFYKCGKPKSVKFGRGMKEIRSDSFKYCNKLSRIYFSGTPEQFDGIRIDGGYADWMKRNVKYYSETARKGCWRYEDDKIKEY